MFFRMIYEENLAAASYLIGCQRTGEAILVDPQRDVDRYLAVAKTEGLRITAVTETHIHADYLSGTREIAEQTGATVYLSGEGGPEWSYQWLDKKSSDDPFHHVLLKEGSIFRIGNIEFRVLHTPGHTPEHIAFVVTDRGAGVTEPIGIASGDFLFVGDMGRPDLLESAAGKIGAADSAARMLYSSVRKLKGLPEFVQVWPGHGAGSACGKALGAVPVSTIGYETRFNPALQASKSEEGFLEYILAGQPEPPLYFARMKEQNRWGPTLLGALPKPRELSLADLKNIDVKRDVLIDTRKKIDYCSGHIAGSFFHPFNRTFVTDIGAMVGENPDIYLICTSSAVEDIVRNLVRVGLDSIRGWFDPSVLDEYLKSGGTLIALNEEAPTEVLQRVTSKSVHVLDVRRRTEHEDVHIAGSQNIVHTRLASQLNELPTDKPLLVHCAGGTRSAYACGLLQRAGFEVINLQGGIGGWEQAGCPVTRGSEVPASCTLRP